MPLESPTGLSGRVRVVCMFVCVLVPFVSFCSVFLLCFVLSCWSLLFVVGSVVLVVVVLFFFRSARFLFVLCRVPFVFCLGGRVCFGGVPVGRPLSCSCVMLLLVCLFLFSSRVSCSRWFPRR